MRNNKPADIAPVVYHVVAYSAQPPHHILIGFSVALALNEFYLTSHTFYLIIFSIDFSVILCLSLFFNLLKYLTML